MGSHLSQVEGTQFGVEMAGEQFSDYNRAFAAGPSGRARALIIKAASGDDRALAPMRPLGRVATAAYCLKQMLLWGIGAAKCCWHHMSQLLHVATPTYKQVFEI